LESEGKETEGLHGGCCVSTCCASSFLDDEHGVPAGTQIKETLRGILSSPDDVEKVLSYCIRLRNQAMRTPLKDSDGRRTIEPLQIIDGLVTSQTPIIDANPD
jgi:hypothetical protein